MIRVDNIDDVALDIGVVSCPEPDPMPTVSGYHWMWIHDTGTAGTSCGNSAIVTSPSVTGKARRFNFTGSGFGGERWSISLAPVNIDIDSLYHQYECMCYINDTTHLRNLEFDLNQVIQNGNTVIFGVQFNFGNSKVQWTTNAGGAHWNDSNITFPKSQFTAGVWHHLIFKYHRDAVGYVTYDSLTFDDVEYPFVNCAGNSAFNLGWTPLGNKVINFQMGTDSAGGTFIGYLDMLSISSWVDEPVEFVDIPPFAEIEQDILSLGKPLPASIIDALNKNILQATVVPEIFPAVTRTSGQTVQLPVSPKDGYVYTRDELHYQWWWNSTGPEGVGEIRLPTFSAHVDSATGLVTLKVWRLPAGSKPYQTNEGSISVVVIGLRQRQLPAITQDTLLAPDDMVPADGVEGSLLFDGQTAAISGELLFQVPYGRGGYYEITFEAKIQQAASSSSTLGGANGFRLHYNAAADNVAAVSPPTTGQTGNTLATQVSGFLAANIHESGDVTFDFGYTSSGATAMKYSLIVSWRELRPTGGPIIDGAQYHWERPIGGPQY